MEVGQYRVGMNLSLNPRREQRLGSGLTVDHEKHDLTGKSNIHKGKGMPF